MFGLDRIGRHRVPHREMTKVVSAANDAGARIIGIAGLGTAGGAKLVARSLAGAFSLYGRRALIVEAAGLRPSGIGAEPALHAAVELAHTLETARSQSTAVDLSEIEGAGELKGDELREAFAALVAADVTLVIDLPSVFGPQGDPNPALPAIGSACDLVFLVCETAQVDRQHLLDTTAFCRFAGINLAGIVLDDRKLLLSSLLAGS
jgi:hypothetical protein